MKLRLLWFAWVACAVGAGIEFVCAVMALVLAGWLVLAASAGGGCVLAVLSLLFHEDWRYELHHPDIQDSTGRWRSTHVYRDTLDGGWVSECPSAGAVSQGDTRAEALTNLADAVDAVLALEAEDRP